MFERGLRPVVVVEILARQQPQIAQPRRLEERVAIERTRGAPDRSTSDPSAARRGGRPRAASRGDSDRSSRRRTRSPAGRARARRPRRSRYGVSQMPIDAGAGLLPHGLRDDADRVGEGDEPGARARAAIVSRAYSTIGGNRPHRHREPDGANRLLRDHAVRERRRLVAARAGGRRRHGCW